MCKSLTVFEGALLSATGFSLLLTDCMIFGNTQIPLVKYLMYRYRLMPVRTLILCLCGEDKRMCKQGSWKHHRHLGSTTELKFQHGCRLGWQTLMTGVEIRTTGQLPPHLKEITHLRHFFRTLSIIFTRHVFILFSETRIISQTKSWVS